MMRQMRQNTKWIMLATALAFVALMLFEWGMDMSGRTAGSLGEIGSVNGVPIRYEDWQAVYRSLYQNQQLIQSGPLSDEQIRQLEDQAFDQMVDRILIQQELERRGIRVTDEEVVQAARYNPPPEFLSAPEFQTEGSFDLQKYQSFLASQAGNQQLLLQLEAYYRGILPEAKLYRQVSEGVYLTDAELWQAYRDANEEVRIRYLALDPLSIPDSLVSVSPSAVREYYEANQEDFEVPARARVRFVTLSTTPTPEDTAASLERAVELRREIVEEEADFAELAMVESADRATAENGGDLGVFTPERMVATFSDAAFSAEVGEVTEPVRTSFGYHLIQVQERWGQDSVRARHILVPIERTGESEDRLLARADSLEALTEGRTLEGAAQALGVALDTVVVSEAFPLLPGAGTISEGSYWLFNEGAAGEVSPVFEGPNAFYAMEILTLQPAGTQPFADAEPTIRRILRQQEKVELVREEATGLVQEIRAGKSLDEVARERELEVREAGPFTRNDFVPDLGRLNAAIGTAFGLEVDQVGGPVVADDRVFVIEVVEKIPADREAWEAQKETQRAQLSRIVESNRRAEWLQGLREEAEVVDRRDEVLRSSDEQDPRASLPLGF